MLTHIEFAGKIVARGVLMASLAPTGTLERKISFYQAHIGVDEGGALLPYDPMPALNALAALPFTDDDSGCYEFDADGNAVCAIVHSTGQTPSLRFCRITKDRSAAAGNRRQDNRP